MAAMLLPLVAGCRGLQSTLDPAGPAAAAIAQAHWIMSAGAAAVLALVIVLMLYATYRNPERRSAPSETMIIIAGGVLLPVVLLGGLLVYGSLLGGRLRADEPGALTLEVVAHQWWWEVRYPGDPSGRGAVTANELRIPVGRPVAIAVTSADVIHSFWIPALGGKIDAIPGRVNRIVLRADRPGPLRGQCAEFCGAQHARMALHVVAEPLADYERWLEGLAAPVPERSAGGEALFARHCAECHVVRGVAAPPPRFAAPDLTHLAGRVWLGAGTLPNTRANVADWIVGSDALKPGNLMPAFRHLDASDVDALAAWLGSPP